MDLTTRELAMILASLRAIQTRMIRLDRQGIGPTMRAKLIKQANPEHFFAVEPLEIIEIDELCDKLNV